MQLPRIPRQHLGNRSRFSRWLGRTILRLLGWRVRGDIPDADRLILVGGPHTSNWDFVVGMSALLAMNMRVHWLGKHTLFRKPYAGFMTWLGGMPVNRAAPGGLAEDVARQIRAEPAMALIITPEGTRSKVEKWKTGFLRIAEAADCTIVIGTLDFSSREIVIGETLQASDDPAADVAYIKACFDRVIPKNPENY